MKVEIKTWDDMEEEFGLDTFGEISCWLSFTIDMEDVMPEDRILEVEESVEKDSEDEFYWEEGEGGWEISRDMIKRRIYEL